MSIYCAAHLVYGVYLTQEEVAAARQLPDWDDIRDRWGIEADMITGDDDTLVIGISEGSVEEGEVSELGNIYDPRSKDIDTLLEVLDTLGIERDPTWNLVCSIG